MAEYLDRDDVLNVIDYIRTKYISVYNRRDKCSQFWADTIRYFEKRINKLDDCDVAPVRHGEWANEETAVACTACGRSYDTDFEIKRNVIMNFKYCPRCGAKMDGSKVE